MLIRARKWLDHRAPWLVLVVLLALIAVEIHGFRTSNLFAQQIWSPEGQVKLVRTAAIYTAGSTAILILVPWLFAPLAAGALILVTLALLPKAVLAVAFFLLSAWCLCQWRSSGASALIFGIALFLIPMPFLARLPVNYPAVYLAILAVPIAVVRPRLRVPEWTGLATWPERLTFALLGFVILIHWFAMLKPEASPDALAMHLAVPADIAAHHVLTFEPARYIWAVMPMGGDFTYAIVYMLGGEYAARLLNLAMLVTLLSLLHTAVRRWVGPGLTWLLLALFAATPIAHLVTGELFIENLLACLLLAAFLAVENRSFSEAGLLSGAALATKLGALPVLAILPFYAALQRPRRRVAFAAVALCLITASPTFLVAWSKTGNPVFPFANRTFHSPLLPPTAEIGDTRFRQPLTWHTAYDVTFRSHLFYEGQSGAFGFQYLVLAPLGLGAALLVRKRMVASASLIGIGAALLILRSEPNARYVYPELSLLIVPFAALLSWAAARQRLLWQLLVGFAIFATGLNIWFMPGSSYWHKDFYGPFTDAQRTSYRSVAAPIRVAIDWFNRAHPGAPVLLTNDTAVAGIAGPVYENQWHQVDTQARIRNARDLPALRNLFDEWQLRYVIARKATLTEVIRPRTLRDLIQYCAATEFEAGEFYVARLLPGCLVKAAPETPLEPTTLVTRGHYDDFDPAILYRGEWERTTNFEEPAAHTTSYSAEPDAAIALAFEGTGLTWTFAKAPNRGIAEVMIDGASQGTVDQYAPSAQWRSHVDFAVPAGRHLLVIRVSGRHREGSEDSYIDLDAFDVR